MVHNGIEYGLMAAYAEGLNILPRANAGKEARAVDAETAPPQEPEMYEYDLDLPDIADVWRRGSVVASWIDEGVPAPILATAVGERFASRGSEEFAQRVLSALRFEFGGHQEKRA